MSAANRTVYHIPPFTAPHPNEAALLCFDAIARAKHSRVAERRVVLHHAAVRRQAMMEYVIE